MSAAPATETPDGAFVSFSTNYEDVVLRRLFRGRTSGFFVDVGAQHPFFGNDFYGLYARGWSGISIEPNPAYFALLQEHRPRDRNLQLALSEVAGQDLVFFEVVDTGLSTCDEAQAAACLAKGYTVERHDVRSSTLRDVLATAGTPHIDILKVDVEGLEEEVLRGNDWERCRPSVIMVEVTYPETAIRRPTGIRRDLEALGYRHVHFDNLNDFFADADFVVPDGALLPPNVFDNFVQFEVLSLRQEAAALRTSASTASEYAHSLEAGRETLEGHCQALQAEYGIVQDALGSLTARAEALGHENAALHLHAARAAEAASQIVATLRSVAVAAILGQTDRLGVLLASGAMAGPEQQEDAPMAEESRELVTIDGEGVTDGAAPQSVPGTLPSEIVAELMAAQMQALEQQNRRFHNDLQDLRHENRRLLASVRQAQGENLSLQRALGPSYAARDELLQLRNSLSSLQTTVADHHRFVSADLDSRVQAALADRLEEMSRSSEPSGRSSHQEGPDSDSALMLQAVLTSTSWRLTRPLRALRRLFGSTDG